MIKKITISILILFAFSSMSYPANYYMQEDGTASSGSPPTAPGPCGTVGNTLGVANHNASTFSSGDTIILCDDGGTFDAAEMNTPTAGVTYEEASGDTVVIGTQIHVDVANITIDGLTFTYAGTAFWEGIINITADACTVQNCLFDGVDDVRSIGVYSAADNCVFDSNVFTDMEANPLHIDFGTGHTVSNNEFYNPNTNGNQDVIRLNSSSTLVTGNYVHTWSENAGAHSDFIQPTVEIDDAIIEHNWVDFSDHPTTDGSTTAFIQEENSGDNWIVRYNIYITQGSGIRVSAGGSDGWLVHGNTFIGDGVITGGHSDRGLSVDNTNSTFENNIIIDFLSYNIHDGGSGNSFDYNLRYNTNDSDPGDLAEQTNDVWKLAPLVIGGGDYTLQANSPAINVGNAQSGSGNYDDALNPANNTAADWPGPMTTLDQDDYADWEIGAYVYGESVDPTGHTGVNIN